MQNPSSSFTSNFEFSSYNAEGRVIDQDLNVPALSFGDPFSTETISHFSILNYPSNANATAEYTFSFIPSQYMGAQSTIRIDFPSAQFGNLASPPECRLSGDQFTFQSCIVSASDLILVTDTDTNQEELVISVFNLINFDEGTSQNFGLTVTYDSTEIMSTSTSTDSITVNTTSQAASLKIDALNFYPQNKGEISTYEFFFTPSLDIS